MKCVEVYKELYHQEPFDVAFCPYRISPLGAHIDHQYGKIDDGTSTNETRLGAVKDIQLAVEKLNLVDDLLVMAGDNVLDFSLSKFVDRRKQHIRMLYL